MSRTCDFCDAEEGKPRPLGKFKVELTPVKAQDGTTKYACQSCVVHHRDKFEGNETKKNSIAQKFQKVLSSFLG